MLQIESWIFSYNSLYPSIMPVCNIWFKLSITPLIFMCFLTIQKMFQAWLSLRIVLWVPFENINLRRPLLCSGHQCLVPLSDTWTRGARLFCPFLRTSFGQHISHYSLAGYLVRKTFEFGKFRCSETSQ